MKNRRKNRVARNWISIWMDSKFLKFKLNVIRFWTPLNLNFFHRLSAKDLVKVWKEPDSLQPVEPQQPRRQFSFNSFGKSMSTQMIRRPDGTMEQRQTITDSEGNTETIITRQFGDQTHTIKTRRDKNGVEMKTEDLINLDESKIEYKKFLILQP